MNDFAESAALGFLRKKVRVPPSSRGINVNTSVVSSCPSTSPQLETWVLQKPQRTVRWWVLVDFYIPKRWLYNNSEKARYDDEEKEDCGGGKE